MTESIRPDDRRDRDPSTDAGDDLELLATADPADAPEIADRIAATLAKRLEDDEPVDEHIGEPD